MQSRIPVLNSDYRAANANIAIDPPVSKAFAGDARVEFQLAASDLQGQRTTWITRTQTNQSSFSTDDSVKSSARKGSDSWLTARSFCDGNFKRVIRVLVRNTLKTWGLSG